jgi:hypothetical protein
MNATTGQNTQSAANIQSRQFLVTALTLRSYVERTARGGPGERPLPLFHMEEGRRRDVLGRIDLSGRYGVDEIMSQLAPISSIVYGDNVAQ